MNQVFKAELKPIWSYEPMYNIYVEADLTQQQILQVNAAVKRFTETIEPILANSKKRIIEKRRLAELQTPTAESEVEG